MYDFFEWIVFVPDVSLVNRTLTSDVAQVKLKKKTIGTHLYGTDLVIGSAPLIKFVFIE